MWIYRVAFLPVPKVIAENTIRHITLENLPVKTFILTFSYNLVSHHREENYHV